MSGMDPKRLAPLNRTDSAMMGKRRRGRNIAMLIVLLLLVALFYAISMVKMAGTHMP